MIQHGSSKTSLRNSRSTSSIGRRILQAVQNQQQIKRRKRIQVMMNGLAVSQFRSQLVKCRHRQRRLANHQQIKTSHRLRHRLLIFYHLIHLLKKTNRSRRKLHKVTLWICLVVAKTALKIKWVFQVAMMMVALVTFRQIVMRQLICRVATIQLIWHNRPSIFRIFIRCITLMHTPQTTNTQHLTAWWVLQIIICRTKEV